MQSPDRVIREEDLLAQMGWVRDLARALVRDPALAEDVAQDAFVKVFAAWDRIDDPSRAEAYLKQTVVNLVRGGHRRELRITSEFGSKTVTSNRDGIWDARLEFPEVPVDVTFIVRITSTKGSAVYEFPFTRRAAD